MRKIFLLVDDDTDDADMFHEALMEVDPSTVFYRAADGRDALATLKNYEHELPHIIFLDINMPRMDGWKCLAELKASDTYKNIPVMMYSTSSHQRDIDIALERGALCFMTKPSEYKELKEILAEIIAHLDDNLLDAIRHFKDVRSRNVFSCQQ
jgi:CheY-like chemotaxis protein